MTAPTSPGARRTSAPSRCGFTSSVPRSMRRTSTPSGKPTTDRSARATTASTRGSPAASAATRRPSGESAPVMTTVPMALTLPVETGPNTTAPEPSRAAVVGDPGGDSVGTVSDPGSPNPFEGFPLFGDLAKLFGQGGRGVPWDAARSLALAVATDNHERAQRRPHRAHQARAAGPRRRAARRQRHRAVRHRDRTRAVGPAGEPGPLGPAHARRLPTAAREAGQLPGLTRRDRARWTGSGRQRARSW